MKKIISSKNKNVIRKICKDCHKKYIHEAMEEYAKQFTKEETKEQAYVEIIKDLKLIQTK